ncbi:SDR family oxidoreductase [Ancylobacter sp. MQZ15Z-1]|uniref:SDR family oxidoreductase n=1 Tax=Ancylobacter mangrovi TaxID=2972472 RepID=A0A9X2T1Z5_9HYPH|nr:SDR family oxidoreductase [Ancylobacter mangrovi]MCS0495307.1 SDR family oxidoreductase [Ancylobacter mangrovi]
MNKLSDKVAVITGGNSGIGLAIARTFVAEGARVLIVGRRKAAVDDAVEGLGERAEGLVGDVADLATHDRVAAVVERKFGRADIYVANAGGIRIQPSTAVSPADYDTQFLSNARGTFFGVQKIAPLLRGGAAILLTSSIATHKVLEGHAVYAGSKAAIEAFARNWTLEFKDRRIRVNVLSPGPTDTPIIGKLGIAAESMNGMEERIAAMIPFGRLGMVEELAAAALFLCSDDSRFITGVNLSVDGGVTLS